MVVLVVAFVALANRGGGGCVGVVVLLVLCCFVVLCFGVVVIIAVVGDVGDVGVAVVAVVGVVASVDNSSGVLYLLGYAGQRSTARVIGADCVRCSVYSIPLLTTHTNILSPPLLLTRTQSCAGHQRGDEHR